MQQRGIGGGRAFTSWLFEPPLKGISAVLCVIGALLFPTLLRLDVETGVMGSECVTFCPFILATAVLAGWRWALLAAAGSAAICNSLLMGAPYHFHTGVSEVVGLATFLVYSLLIVGFVGSVRSMARRAIPKGDSEADGKGIVFSSEAGEAWASWYGLDAKVRLGPEREVASMMEDFLAQVELAKRWNGAPAGMKPRHAVVLPLQERRAGY